MAAQSMPTSIFDRLSTQEGLGVPLTQKLKRSVLRFGRWWLHHQDYRATLNELSALSDRELDDIGIVRVDIPLIARQSANIAAARRL